MRNAIASPCSATDFHTPTGYEALALNRTGAPHTLGAQNYLLGIDVAIDYEMARQAKREAVRVDDGASVTIGPVAVRGISQWKATGLGALAIVCAFYGVSR